MSARAADVRAGSHESALRLLPVRAARLRDGTVAMGWAELRKLRHDHLDIFTRSVQPLLWLFVFGTALRHNHALAGGSDDYRAYLAPGVMAQAALFVAIFFGLGVIWERDVGQLQRLLATPMPRLGIVLGKAAGAAVRALTQAVVLLCVIAIAGIGIKWSVPRVVGAVVLLLLGTMAFASRPAASCGWTSPSSRASSWSPPSSRRRPTLAPFSEARHAPRVSTEPGNREILAVDVGGSHVKALRSSGGERRRFESGPDLTARQMVDGVLDLTSDWDYDVVSIGIPAPVRGEKVAREPVNLGGGWVGFDFEQAFGRPTKLVNDAVMQALGDYHDGTMLFLGLGTGLGSTLVVDGKAVPLELAHLPFRKATFEDYVGERGREQLGKKKWHHAVAETVELLAAATVADYVVLGGGNAKKIEEELPPNVRLGANQNAFLGGFRLWDPSISAPPAG